MAKQKKLVRVVCAVLALLMAATLVLPALSRAFADDETPAEKLERLRKEIAALHDQIEASEENEQNAQQTKLYYQQLSNTLSAQLEALQEDIDVRKSDLEKKNLAIAQAAEQNHNISKLQAAGLLDTDACAAKLNAINIQLTQLRRERRRLLEHDDIEDTIGRLHQTADAIKAGPERLDTFDEDLFEELVEEIVAESQTRIRFRLHGGIELAEKVGRAKR